MPSQHWSCMIAQCYSLAGVLGPFLIIARKLAAQTGISWSAPLRRVLHPHQGPSSHIYVTNACNRRLL